MFSAACMQIRNSIYGFRGISQIGAQLQWSLGSAFMISPGVIATTAHSLHLGNIAANPQHQKFEVIGSSDIGQTAEVAMLVAEDVVRDLALLRIVNPRSNASVKLSTVGQISTGTSCGSLGFPLAEVQTQPVFSWNLVERFQGSNVSAYRSIQMSNRTFFSYEKDTMMYAGSSGCPYFLQNGEVFAMQSAALDSPVTNQHQTHTRMAIAFSVPSSDIRAFANSNGVII